MYELLAAFAVYMFDLVRIVKNISVILTVIILTTFSFVMLFTAVEKDECAEIIKDYIKNSFWVKVVLFIAIFLPSQDVLKNMGYAAATVYVARQGIEGVERLSQSQVASDLKTLASQGMLLLQARVAEEVQEVCEDSPLPSCKKILNKEEEDN